ncbi:MAG: hypothetical protein D6732_25880 [Methanobacteriota archaeon]|nr:MAG: hypothetical protein D6732_25880 [Euryarchaeota archaeon]
MEILLNIRTVGSFQVGSVKEFWRRFRGYLCSSCQMKLDSMGIYQQRALELLEEAVKLDPDNKIVKENLKKVKQMI